jgi:hypothetical protein
VGGFVSILGSKGGGSKGGGSKGGGSKGGGSKGGQKVESSKNTTGERSYRIAK